MSQVHIRVLPKILTLSSQWMMVEPCFICFVFPQWLFKVQLHGFNLFFVDFVLSDVKGKSEENIFVSQLFICVKPVLTSFLSLDYVNSKNNDSISPL